MDNDVQPDGKIVKEVHGGVEYAHEYRKARIPMPKEVLDNLMANATASEEDLAEGKENKAAKAMAVGASMGFCPDFDPRTVKINEHIIREQDIEVVMRDGTKIYCDIYRPTNTTEKIPVIVSWSYFGKRPGDGMDEWQLIGVPPGTVSTLAKFESCDPSYWCRHGYAIANVDPRGCGHSEGDLIMFGTQDAKDGYDFIEWVAKQEWCNGKVGMNGNSGVAMTQYRIAAEQPPSLACIAPWEGTGDIYREALFAGGIPAIGFEDFIEGSLVGKGYIGNNVAMARKHPFMCEFWEDRIPQWQKIKVPTYLTGCWQHMHLRGAMECFRKIRSTKKWIRVHREFEWPDAYDPHNLEDLKRFYDRYMKDIYNGWELTPRVRLEVMDAFDCDYQVNRSEKEFPLKRTEYRKLFLDAKTKRMRYNPFEKEAKVGYESEKGILNFDFQFNEQTEITGYMKLRLWVSCADHDDMDIFVNIQKLSTTGQWLPTSVLDEPHPGSWGKMRVSRRALDEKLSTHYQPVQAHTKDEKLKPGEIVPVDIEISPVSRIWHKGQYIRIQLAGHYVREGWFEPHFWDIENKGEHVIHTGGRYDTYLQIPVIPPKYADGEYVYR